MTEIRCQPLVGTRYVQYYILVDGVIIHSQLSPYSDAERDARVALYWSQGPAPEFRMAEFVPGARGTAKSYGSKGEKARKTTYPPEDE